MARVLGRARATSGRFSPLHEGDTSVAIPIARIRLTIPQFQSPSRGGHLCGCEVLDVGGAVRERFSPLHEGDTSVAQLTLPDERWYCSFSPLHEGDTSVARALATGLGVGVYVSVPFTRGTPLWPRRSRSFARSIRRFQSPSRGGHLCGEVRVAVHALLQIVSVPFTRGTPLWRAALPQEGAALPRFSPLHEGDTSVAECYLANFRLS